MENTHDSANRPDSVPFIVHENALMRAEHQIKRMWVAMIAAIVAAVLIVAGFLWYLSQYDFVSSESVTVDGSDGVANYIGNDGMIYNGEDSSTESTNPPKEERVFEGNT